MGINDWRLISLGKGYYHIILNTESEKTIVWAKDSLNCKSSIIHLQEWSLNFNPMIKKLTTTQVWVRLYGLNWVLWHLQILSNIAHSIRVPLRFDYHIVNGYAEHFVRILVDVDLANPLTNYVVLDVDGVDIEVELHYEKLPMFCTTCKNIGHGLSTCRLVEKNSKVF